jgi:phage terminase large subunit-like protein
MDGLTAAWPEYESELEPIFQPALALVTAPEADPLLRLHDPAFAGELFDFEYSYVGPLPQSLHVKQQEARTDPARHHFLFWANQSGKSSFVATEWDAIALGRHPVYSRLFAPPVVLWASSLTWDLWETVQLPELLSWLPHDRIIAAPEPFKRSTNRIILVRADNGTVSRIEGKSAEQGRAKYQARRVHGIWFDEEHPESIWDEALMRLVRFGGITYTSATPLKGFTWLYHRIYEPHKLGKLDRALYFVSHAGMADNPGIPPEEVAQAAENLKHNRAQLAARLFGHFAAPVGLALQYDPDRHQAMLSDERCRELVAMGQCFAGIDFGAWRFAFTLWAADRDGRVWQIDEYFSQRERLGERAFRIHAMLEKYKAPARLPIWGDAANPQDIMELNAAFLAAESGHSVVPVAMENKLRAASVERLNDLLGREALHFRRGVAEGRTWMLGYNASSDGKPVEGSRLLWEVGNWCYPDPGEGKAQRQDPEDHTADGADAIASMRYAVMSWWRAAKPATEKQEKPANKDTGLERLLARLDQQKKRDKRRR